MNNNDNDGSTVDNVINFNTGKTVVDEGPMPQEAERQKLPVAKYRLVTPTMTYNIEGHLIASGNAFIFLDENGDVRHAFPFGEASVRSLERIDSEQAAELQI